MIAVPNFDSSPAPRAAQAACCINSAASIMGAEVYLKSLAMARTWPTRKTARSALHHRRVRLSPHQRRLSRPLPKTDPGYYFRRTRHLIRTVARRRELLLSRAIIAHAARFVETVT